MARHEFGIMTQPPVWGKRYDEYEPEKYACISVDDEVVERLDRKLGGVKTYWHTLSRQAQGLAYCGITLIPPESFGRIREALEKEDVPAELSRLLDKAEREGFYLIHFGL